MHPNKRAPWLVDLARLVRCEVEAVYSRDNLKIALDGPLSESSKFRRSLQDLAESMPIGRGVKKETSEHTSRFGLDLY